VRNFCISSLPRSPGALKWNVPRGRTTRNIGSHDGFPVTRPCGPQPPMRPRVKPAGQGAGRPESCVRCVTLLERVQADWKSGGRCHTVMATIPVSPKRLWRAVRDDTGQPPHDSGCPGLDGCRDSRYRNRRLTASPHPHRPVSSAGNPPAPCRHSASMSASGPTTAHRDTRAAPGCRPAPDKAPPARHRRCAD
jgi:hypothetical protein